MNTVSPAACHVASFPRQLHWTNSMYQYQTDWLWPCNQSWQPQSALALASNNSSLFNITCVRVTGCHFQARAKNVFPGFFGTYYRDGQYVFWANSSDLIKSWKEFGIINGTIIYHTVQVRNIRHRIGNYVLYIYRAIRTDECSTVVIFSFQLQTLQSAIASLQRSEYLSVRLAE
jgi:hypothetical protein